MIKNNEKLNQTMSDIRLINPPTRELQLLRT